VLFRSKAAFRRRISEAGDVLEVGSFAVGREELVGLEWEEIRRRLGPAPDGLVVKPVRGFQSDLVSICRDAADWGRARARIAHPPRGISPVTDASAFVVETYVRGEELAIDVYFDAAGAPVVLGLYLHPFRDERDARDIVYRTSRPLTRRYRQRFERALASWNERLGLRDFAVHAEVRVTARDEVFPIELNPLRFGLLTMDISLYAFGVNSYLHFFERTAPDWARLEAEPSDEATALIVAPLPESYREGMKVDQKAFERDLVERGLRIHRFQPLPYEEIPFYAAAYVGGRAETMDAYLDEDFGRHVRPA
jgi:biotin carboxylase